MKALTMLFVVSWAVALTACSSTRGGGSAQVEFIHPEKYSDIKSRDIPEERVREIVLPDLQRYIEKQARVYLPAGQQLTLRITDIDDAGWVNPVGAFSHRTVRSHQPGRVDFEYVLSDAGGRVVSEGRETLSDLPWDRTDRSFENEQLPLIKQMLRNWIREIGKASSS
jgi:hypothetical protein